MVNYETQKEKLKALCRKMETCSQDEGLAAIDTFVRDYEESLYCEIGRLTRQLHESIISFPEDDRLNTLTKNDITGTKERLKHVIEITEITTQKVLENIEKSNPIIEKIGMDAIALQDRLIGASESADKNISSDEIRLFLTGIKNKSEFLRNELSEILMAQEFQDITGQIIRKVMNLVQGVEDNLVRLITLTGTADKTNQGKNIQSELAGPCVPRADDNSLYAAGQDEVDSLLANLGF